MAGGERAIGRLAPHHFWAKGSEFFAPRDLFHRIRSKGTSGRLIWLGRPEQRSEVVGRHKLLVSGPLKSPFPVVSHATLPSPTCEPDASNASGVRGQPGREAREDADGIP